MTQPFSDRRHTRSGTDGANDDKDARDRDKPHRLYPEYPCRDHDGQDYGANTEPVEVHPPGEQATQHCGSVWHTAYLADRPKMTGGPSGTPLHPGLARSVRMQLSRTARSPDGHFRRTGQWPETAGIGTDDGYQRVPNRRSRISDRAPNAAPERRRSPPWPQRRTARWARHPAWAPGMLLSRSAPYLRQA